MKKSILFLGFLLMVFGLRIDAQTLKNIHRHNQPVLRIPTHLIDKVETAEVNGAQVLQVRQLNGYVSEIPLTQIDSITHSEGEAVDPAQLGNLRTASVMGVVTGPTGAPEMNAIVRSPYGGEETRTDPNGVFFLNNILVYDKLGYITITKPGFHQGSRSFLPLETGSNRVNVQLLPMTQSGSFSAASGGTVTSGLLQLTFPANAVSLNGQPYTGTVRVFASALDPTSPTMFDRMPGELLGGLNDSLRLLRSFGMASVELRDTNMNDLQLADSTFATLTFSIPSSLQAEAPQNIDWWSFDETLGYWKHEGVAIKQDSQFVGQASHFSWWNVDVPENFNELLGFIHTPENIPISDALIHVISPTMGTGVTYTNSEGRFTGRVPKNQQITLDVNLICTSSNNWTLVHTETISSVMQDINIELSASIDEQYPITGTIVKCNGLPVTAGYITLGSQVFITENGSFTILTCSTSDNIIRGYDSSNPDSIKVSEFDTIQVPSEGINIGEMHACLQYSGTMIDINGNIYKTVLIGRQLWTAENLRTANYNNGDPILGIIDNNSWLEQSSGAWSNYNNNNSNDSLYGKLYNWYTTTDPRGLCPTGWHVPTYFEWGTLAVYLGGPNNVNAGAKMKSVGTQYWISPNAGATNESGFSGLPGGIRISPIGAFAHIGMVGYHWCTSETMNGGSWAWELHSSTMGLGMTTYNKQNGCSVRCLKD